MAEGGGAAPPPEARRAGVGKGIFAVVVVVVAILAFVGGLALGPVVFPPAAQVPTLVVGTNIPFPPFEDYNTTTNTFFGFDIDIARLIAHASHRTLVVKNFADFDALLATVGKNGVDIELAALRSGPLTAVIIDNAPAGAFAAGSGGALVVAGTIFTGEQYSFAVAHLDPQDLIPVINGVIFTSQQNGTYQQLITKWFG